MSKHGLLTFNLDEVSLPVKVKHRIYRGGTEFRVIVPKDYLYPSAAESHEAKGGDILTLPDIVKSFPHLSHELAKIDHHEMHLDGQGRWRDSLYVLESGSKKYWMCEMKLPLCIRNIIAEALRHEASINRGFWSSICIVDIRFEIPKSGWERSETNAPHFDGGAGDILSLYILTSEPTTVVYTGPFERSIHNEEHPQQGFSAERITMAPLSLLPRKLIHADRTFLHSQPWELFPPGVTIPRFFIRIMFRAGGVWWGAHD